MKEQLRIVALAINCIQCEFETIHVADKIHPAAVKAIRPSGRFQGASVALFLWFQATTLLVAQTWTGISGGSWGAATNWSPATVPNAVDAVANINSASTVDVLDTGTGGAFPYVFGTLATTGVSGNVVVGNPSNGAEQLTAQAASGSPFFSINSGATLWFYFVLNGTQGFTKTGGGTLTFRYNAETQPYSGNVIISGGTLGLNVDANLGNTNNDIIISNNAALLFNPTTSAPLTLAPTRNVTLACPAANFDVANINYALTILGVVNESVTGSGLQKTDAGTLVLSGTNTYTGATTISGGTFTLAGAGLLGNGAYAGAIANSGIFNENSSATQIFSGVISGSGTLNKNGSGTLTLSAVDTYTGATTIGAGTLALGNSGAINNTPSIRLAAGATYDVSAITSYNLSSSTTLIASGGTSPATIKGSASGTVNLGSRPITLNFDGLNPALVISQGALSLSGQTVTVNTTGFLSNGTYNLIKINGGSIVHSGNYTLAGTGTNAAASSGLGFVTNAGVAYVTLTIAGSAVIQTTNSLSGNDTSIYGNASSITATVTPGTATGTMQFYVDSNAFGNAVTLAGGSAPFPAAPPVAVGAHNISAVFFGTGAYASGFATNIVTLTVTPRSVTVTASGVNKFYDGTSNATVVLSDNRVAGDGLTDSYTNAVFATTSVANNILLTVTGIAISGAVAGYYSLANTTATTTASILPPVSSAEFDALRLSWQNSLIGSNQSAATLNSWAATANGYWSTLNTNAGRTNLWSDLTLGSGQPGINTGSSHMDATFGRLEAMAMAWAANGGSLQGNPNLMAAITNGLDWMCANVYTPTTTEYDNWWDWEIGGLQNLNNAAVLMYPALTARQITNYNASVDHFLPPHTRYGNSSGWMTGANLTDECKGMLIRAILGQDNGKMLNAQTNLSPVFPYVTNSDGFYRDGSFVFHGVHPYTGGYGLTLLGDVGQLVNLLNGSSWQITDPNLTNVFNWVVQSYEPVCYHGEFMAMVSGRGIARGPAGSGGVPWVIAQVAQFAPPATAAAIASWAGTLAMPPSQYQFACMDCVVAWRTNFCAGLRMSSSRIATFESFAGENLHGWFTGDGMTYLYLGSGESQFTSDFWPTVDAYHLPGTTVEQFTRPAAVNNSAYGAGQTTGQSWVGGAQVASLYGTAGMSLAAYGTTLTAKKSWFMFDNEIVCLGAGITSGDASEVDTTVEDRRVGTSPTNNFTVNGAVQPPVFGWSSNLMSTTWCALDGVAGYYFPGGATNLRAAFVTNTGSWYAIDNSEATNLYTDGYLTLWFNHGVKPTNSTYAYVVLPNYTAANMATYAASPDMVVLTNTTTVQAASKPATGLVAANFWVDGTNSADFITVNKKSAVIVSQNNFQIAVGVADPTQTNSGSILVTLNRPATAVLSADPGVTVVQLSPQIVLSVNVNASAGKTYQAVFSSPLNSLTWDANPSGSGTHPLDGSGTWNSSNTNWWNGGADVAWSDVNPLIANFGANGTAGTVTVSGAHTNSWLLFNPTTSGTYTLSGSGSLTLKTGLMANASANINVPLILPVSQTWTVATNQTVSLGGALTLASPYLFSLAGDGTVRLNAGNNQLPTSATVSIAGNGALDLGGNSQTLANVVAANGCTGSLQNGNLTVTAAGGFNPFSTLTSSAGMDLSGLNTFTYNQSGQSFTVQGTAASGGYYNLYLAGSNRVTAANVYVGNGSGSPSTTGNLYLGQTNVFNCNLLQLGSYKGSGNVYLESGLVNAQVVLRGVSGGSSRLGTLTVLSQSSGASQTGTMDLGAAKVDALVGTLYVLNTVQPGIAETATLNFGSGVFDITTLDLAYVNSGNNGTANSTGNVNQNGGLTKVQTLNFGATGNPAGTPIFKPGYTLADGATLAAQTITAAAGTPYNSASLRYLNLNGGTVSNYDAATDLTISGADSSSGGVVNLVLGAGTTSTFNAGSGRNITIQNTAPISGSGGLVKTGAGTLTLAGVNNYSGATLVSSGSLLVNGLLGASAVTVANGGALGGSGGISGGVLVQSGGTVLAGNTGGAGTLTVGTLNLGESGSAITASRFNLAAGGKISATTLNVTGTHTINISDSSLAFGTNTLLTYSGIIGGGGFAGLKLGTLPALPPGAAAYLRSTGSTVQLVVAPLVAPVINPTVSRSGGGFGLSFSGINGQSYRVLSSTNLTLSLTNWLLLTNGIFGAGQINFLDSNATNNVQFYRVASP